MVDKKETDLWAQYSSIVALATVLRGGLSLVKAATQTHPSNETRRRNRARRGKVLPPGCEAVYMRRRSSGKGQGRSWSSEAEATQILLPGFADGKTLWWRSRKGGGAYFGR
jgi:hypothetical protein